LAGHLNLQRPAQRRKGGSVLPPLILVTDEQRLADPMPAVAGLPAGSLVIFRHYDWPDRRLLAVRLAKLCRARRLRLLVAGDIDLAVRLGLGVHLPEGLLRSAPVKLRLRHRKRPGLLLTVAAHGRQALVRARRWAANAALLAPVFPTESHPGKTALGLLAFRRLAATTPIAVFALGGVTAHTISALVGSGAAGIAAVGGLSRPAGGARHSMNQLDRELL
jgi:thiamine-phosphate pyrophosphorylase